MQSRAVRVLFSQNEINALTLNGLLFSKMSRERFELCFEVFCLVITKL